MKYHLLCAALLAGFMCKSAVSLASTDSSSEEKTQCLFKTPDEKGVPYRIPAITTTRKGDVIAMADYRYCGADIGFGQIDIVARVSKNNGTSWGEAFTVAKGNGIKGDDACGYGDAAIVADAKSNKILVMCCTGNITYWASTREKPLRVARFYSENNGKTWTQPDDITEAIYSLFDSRADKGLQKLFIGSGRICQSKKIKVGKYYRVYAALCTNKGNYVIYSDDLGEKWNVLGDVNLSPAPKGDEPKCEELPDGNVLLSSRKGYGRYYNIYSYVYTSKGIGGWGKVVSSDECEGGIKTGSNSTNGEVYLVKAKRLSDGKKVDLLLQSLPIAKGRAQVSIFYKPLLVPSDYNTPVNLASNWEGSYEVTSAGSAYSTMCIQKDATIGFFYEEEPNWYNMVYKSLSLEKITSGKYKLLK